MQHHKKAFNTVQEILPREIILVIAEYASSSALFKLRGLCKWLLTELGEDIIAFVRDAVVVQRYSRDYDIGRFCIPIGTADIIRLFRYVFNTVFNDPKIVIEPDYRVSNGYRIIHEHVDEKWSITHRRILMKIRPHPLTGRGGSVDSIGITHTIDAPGINVSSGTHFIMNGNRLINQGRLFGIVPSFTLGSALEAIVAYFHGVYVEKKENNDIVVIDLTQ